jgi:hypothetical protein
MNKKVTLSMDEIRRLDVIYKVENNQLTGIQAAERLDLSERQVRRLIASFRERERQVLCMATGDELRTTAYRRRSGRRSWNWRRMSIEITTIAISPKN